jgi:hypothetical protein
MCAMSLPCANGIVVEVAERYTGRHRARIEPDDVICSCRGHAAAPERAGEPAPRAV